jgi:hypothetical protein
MRGASEFVQMAIGQTYSMAHTFSWAPIWQDIVEFSMSEGWHRDRARLLERLAACPPQKLADARTWEPVFDKINAALHGHLELMPQLRSVRLLARVRAVYGLEQGRGTATDLRDLVQAVPLDVGQVVTNVAIDALIAIVEHLPVRQRVHAALVAERALHSVERHSHMLACLR